ncbi:RNA 2',3'-cyclic phosphodiesterase [Bacillus massiliigorillae]|uniref:RNA 2',3'-cyclic phosphodiesterase n=1 Tax=Bacillus massiliigorillae TaxID=1243664 RepID=UPI0003AAFB24|nr:RNA 2',3'-cyclic phosphodiesterase [Bacillus massiliigorillae]
MNQHHYFIALSLPEHVKNQLHTKVNVLQERYDFKKWVHKEDFHITLAFLGASDEQKWQNCMEKVAEQLKDYSAFPLRLTHFGVFGHHDKPRIFWCGPQYEECLYTLQTKVSEACKQSGYILDTKPFNPHITIARKYNNEMNFTEEHLKECNDIIEEGISFEACRISLFETHMDKVPKYQELQTIYI